MANIFKKVNSQVDFIKIEHDMLDLWEKEQTFNQLRENNKGKKPGITRKDIKNYVLNLPVKRLYFMLNRELH